MNLRFDVEWMHLDEVNGPAGAFITKFMEGAPLSQVEYSDDQIEFKASTIPPRTTSFISLRNWDDPQKVLDAIQAFIQS